MSSKTLVSIVIPVYNMEHYLSQCIDSVIAQTYRALEIIIINDGSSDRSLDIAYDLARKDQRIVVIDKPNGGVSSARNEGIERMQGSYVTFVDADDSIHPTYIENLLADAQATDADIVSTPKHLLGDAERQDFLDATIPVAASASVFTRTEALTALYNGQLEKGNNGCQLYKTEIIKHNDIRFDSQMAIGEDFDFLARAIISARCIAVDNRRLYYYRANPTSAVHQEFNIRHYQAIENMQKTGRALHNPPKKLVQAMDNNLFVASASYGALMYASRKKFPREFDEIKRTVRRLKWGTLLSRDVKHSGRIRAALIICLGINLGFIVIRKLIKI